MVRGTSQFLYSTGTNTPPKNPNEILSQSPELRGTRYPGSPSPNITIANRNAVATIPFSGSQTSAITPLALFPFPNMCTQGSADKSGQPWAEGHNPVGIE